MARFRAALMLVRVVAPDFVAAFIIENGIVQETAPILRSALFGKPVEEARRIISKRGWKASIIDHSSPWRSERR
jgi:hypothetical protein